MRLASLALFAASLSAITNVAAQDSASGWQEMKLSDFSTPSQSDVLQTLVWPDIIREQNAYLTTELKRPLNGKNAPIAAIAAVYRDGARTIIVSVISTRGCDHGANDKGAEIQPSTCPLRIATIQHGRLLSTKTLTGCYADHDDPDLPPKNRTDGTYSRFDPVARTVSLRTMVAGKDVPVCARTISIQ